MKKIYTFKYLTQCLTQSTFKLDDYFLKTLTWGHNSYSSVLCVCIYLDNECFPQETKITNTRWNPICFRHLRTHFQNSQCYFVHTHTHTHTHIHTHTHTKEQPEVIKEISISFRKRMENIKIIKSIFFFSMMSKSINSSDSHSHILKHLSLWPSVLEDFFFNSHQC